MQGIAIALSVWRLLRRNSPERTRFIVRSQTACFLRTSAGSYPYRLLPESSGMNSEILCMKL
jgi:hypothetical protein